MKIKSCFLVVLLVLMFAGIAKSSVSMSALFSDNMVLQQKTTVIIWGYAKPFEQVSVKASWNNSKTNCETDIHGVWKCAVNTISFGGPYDIEVCGENRIILSNIMLGDVWLCSGQSNMEMPIASWGKVINFESEVAQSGHENIRYFNVSHYTSNQPLPDVKVFKSWQVASPAVSGDFSAVAYFFARQVNRHTGIPIGIIHASYQGTAIESWLNASALRADPARILLVDSIFNDTTSQKRFLKRSAATTPADIKKVRPQDAPGVLFNAMIWPLRQYAIKGFLWYQGENNVGRPGKYAYDFKRLISAWRQTFGGPELPFYFVQLANYNAKTTAAARSHWAELRAAQAQALILPHTGMAVTIDIGEAANVHPKNKQEVGRRLALIALSKTYEQRIAFSGPVVKKIVRRKNKLLIYFRHANKLHTEDGAAPKGFIVAGADKKFYEGRAVLHGKHVAVSSDFVKAPVAVRYAWADNPDINLYNASLLPPQPFMID